MERGMLLSICYAANTGGMASLTGTGPNLVLKAAVDDLYEDYGLDSPVTFGTWMALGLPLSAMVLILCWLWLQAAFLGCRGSCNVCKEGSEESKRVHEVIAEEYRKMGPVSCSQKIIISLFVILVALWITRDLGGVVGWAKTYPSKFINSSCPAMCIALLLFAIPRSLPKPAREGEGVKKAMPLMEWPYIQKRLPWHLVFLIGGGFALSKGSKRSGLSAMLGKQLDVFGGIDKWGVLFFISYATSLLTEVTSNSAICNLVLPILTELALRTGVHPLYYMITAALSCSFAYMLPVATAPNAIVYGTGKIRMTLMIKIGVVMNIVAVPLLIVMTGTLGDAIFDFDNVPAAFLNSTAAASP
ncbi:solute carrier family 13 member 5 [Aplysia californica]|uniref:Solute carrier family 13 member 5 n=1 Tax=Aplysia californica TaxID=6500 RepID=A0ABM1A7G5_APLCA|nr:solute carrier family 13 member 5 [Aplysia californica]